MQEKKVPEYHWIDFVNLSKNNLVFTVHKKTPSGTRFAKAIERLFLRKILNNYLIPILNPEDLVVTFTIPKKRVVSKVLQLFLALAKKSNLIVEADEQLNTISALEKLKAEIDKDISTSNRRKNFAEKNKFISGSKILPDKISTPHSHETYKIARIGKDNKVKRDFLKIAFFDSDHPLIEAFIGNLHILLLGKEYFAKINAVFTPEYFRHGVLSREVANAQTLGAFVRSLTSKTLSAPEKAKISQLLFDTLIPANFIEALAITYVLKNDDLHEDNIFFKDGKIILFDVDRCLFPLVCVYFGWDPSKKISAERIAPVEAFITTLADMDSFPILNDAKPFWWPLSNKSILAPFLQNIEQIPEVQYRVIKFFLKVSLINQATIQAVADVKIRPEKSNKSSVEFVTKCFQEIKDKLKSMKNYATVLAQNPQLHEELIRDFEDYNRACSEKHSKCRVDIREIQTILIANYQPNAELVAQEFVLLQEKFTNIERIIRITKEYISLRTPKEFSDDNIDLVTSIITDLTNLQIKIRTMTSKWPQNKLPSWLIQKEIYNAATYINSIQNSIDNKIFNFPYIKKLIALQDKMTTINNYIGLTKNSKLIAECNELIARNNFITEKIDKLVNQQVNQLTDIEIARINKIEIETKREIDRFAEIVNKSAYSLAEFNVSTVQLSPSDQLVNEIKCMLNRSISDLKDNYPGKFFADIKLVYLIGRLRQKCAEALMTLNTQKNSDLKNLQIEIISIVYDYLNTPDRKVSTQRFINCGSIIEFTLKAEDLDVLHKELYSYRDKINGNSFKSSDLKNSINKVLERYHRQDRPNSSIALAQS